MSAERPRLTKSLVKLPRNCCSDSSSIGAPQKTSMVGFILCHGVALIKPTYYQLLKPSGRKGALSSRRRRPSVFGQCAWGFEHRCETVFRHFRVGLVICVAYSSTPSFCGSSTISPIPFAIIQRTVPPDRTRSSCSVKKKIIFLFSEQHSMFAHLKVNAPSRAANRAGVGWRSLAIWS
jgi:hypothetical protein